MVKSVFVVTACGGPDGIFPGSEYHLEPKAFLSLEGARQHILGQGTLIEETASAALPLGFFKMSVKFLDDTFIQGYGIREVELQP
jgi:hypothetical protein